jgi:DNA helicase II / ATP-dependent DNA helicase PcrA
MASLLSGLTDAQRLAVTSTSSPLCVVAGAGSGKTSVLTRRVARRVLDGSASVEHALVVTFTRKAAGELRHRLGKLGVTGTVHAGTFHAAAYRQLRRYWADKRQRPPVLLDDAQRLVTELLHCDAHMSSTARRALVSAVVTEVHWAQARLIAPEDYPSHAAALGRGTPLPYAEVAELLVRYRDAKNTRGLLDFDDLLTRCTDMIEQDATMAAAVRWRVRHLFVDEFQDANPAQWRLLMAWLGHRDDLFVVGDPAQAVYSWNGADPELIDRMPTLLPGTTVIGLDENHRSSPQVVRAACAVLGSPTAPTSRPDGPEPVVHSFEDDGEEAQAVVRWLRLAHRPGRSWAQTAVLARTHARLEPVARALEEAGIPFRLSNGGASPGRYRRLGDGPLESARAFLARLPRDRPLRAAVAELVVDSAAPIGGLVARLVDEHIEETTDATAGSFVDWLAANDEIDADHTGPGTTPEGEGAPTPAVELATFHRAKGLQWPAVCVVGLEAGTVPIIYASSAAARAEERRLLYVALSRAEEDLWCSWARQRTVGDNSWECTPSPFLAPIDARRAGHGASEADVLTVTDRIAALRSQLPAAG